MGNANVHEFRIPFTQNELHDPRPALTEFIEEKVNAYRIYSDKPDKKQTALIKMETEIRFLESIETNLKKMPMNWDVMLLIGKAIEQVLSQMGEAEGISFVVAFKQNPRADRCAFVSLKLYQD